MKMYITMPAPIRGVCTLQTGMVSFTVLFELAGGSLSVHYTPCIEGENNKTKTTRTSSSCNDTIQPRRWPTMCTPLLLGRTDRCKQRGCPSGAPSLGFCGDRVQPDYPRECGVGREEKRIYLSAKGQPSLHTHSTVLVVLCGRFESVAGYIGVLHGHGRLAKRRVLGIITKKKKKVLFKTFFFPSFAFHHGYAAVSSTVCLRLHVHVYTWCMFTG